MMGRENPAERLAVPPETAATLLTSRVPVASPEARGAEVRRSLRGNRFDVATEIAVCDDGKLVGLLGIEDLLVAPDGAAAGDLMDADPPVVVASADQEVAAWMAARHGKATVAVVDGDGRFLGLIPSRRLVAALFSEHEEDMARLGGFLKTASSARMASEETVARRLWHRLPWLLVGLGGALLSADIVGAFEAQLRDRVILAFFVPGVVYLADAVGTQTARAGVLPAGAVAVGPGRRGAGRVARAARRVLDRLRGGDDPAMGVRAARRGPRLWERAAHDGGAGTSFRSWCPSSSRSVSYAEVGSSPGLRPAGGAGDRLPTELEPSRCPFTARSRRVTSPAT